MAIENRNGIWHIRLQVCGRKIHQTTGLAATALNRRKAQALEARLSEEMNLESRFGIRHIKTCTFSEGAKEFKRWLQTQYSEKWRTRTAYASNIACASRFFDDTPISSIRAGDIERLKIWRADQKCAPATVRLTLVVVSLFFDFARRQGWCAENPCVDVKKPSTAGSVRIKVVSPEEEKRYFDAALKLRLQSMYDVGRLMILQGMRPQEVVCLRVEDVDLSRRQVRIRTCKTASAYRTLDLTTEAVQILSRRVLSTTSPWLFPSVRKKNSEPLAGVAFHYQHHRVCRAAGVDFVLYAFRHTFATRMAESGTDLPTLAALLGHSGLGTVQKYIHVSAEHKREAMVRYDARLRPTSTMGAQE